MLANAAKYSGQGTEPDEASYRVRDDGPGIAPDEAERLFDLFYRSPTTASATTGAGIGLFVCSPVSWALAAAWARPLPAGGAEFGFAPRVMYQDRPAHNQ